MSLSQKQALVGRIETQALLGERLLVTGVHNGWLHVVAVAQPTHRDSRGYPGWVPRRQVTTHPPTTTPYVATVTTRLAQLRSVANGRSIWVSVATRLPVIATRGTTTVVATPTGTRRAISDTSIVVRPRGQRPLPLTRSSVLASARRFLGTPYIWGGRSGWAVDCSGYTNLVYGLHGVRLPRDADDQALRGVPVTIGTQRRSDLLFFRDGSTIGHVGFYVGHGTLLHAPHTGTTVSTIPLTTIAGLAAVRRFVH
jgi:cell wall-associated NlpC family hydrolase